MNLKEAFRLQNKLQSMMTEAAYILEDDRNVLKVRTTHLRSKVMDGAEDVTIEENAPSKYAGQANELAAFLLAMLDEREKLSAAIHAAKAALPIDMDSETGLNRQRQQLAETFRRMAALRNGEVIISGGGTGYRFNGEGNQVSYRCDAQQVTTLDFDRDKIRGMAVRLSRQADQTSAALDRCLINTEVAYEPPFDMNDSFDEILTAFIDRRAGQAET